MANTAGMHLKVKNFFVFLSKKYTKYFTEDKEEDTISLSIKTVADDKGDYKNFYFGYLAAACNNHLARPRIAKVRDLHKNPEDVQTILTNVRTYSSKARHILDQLDAIPEEKMIKYITKVSRYIDLFTLLYFKDSK